MKHRAAPPPMPKVYDTKQKAQRVADARRCHLCGWTLFAEQDYGGWVLHCGNSRGHQP